MSETAAAVSTVGERLREARQARGVSLRALARDIGVSPSLISQIETGKSQPSVSTLYAITSALGISVEYVFQARETPVAVDLPAPATLLDVLGSARGHRVGPLRRPAERQIRISGSPRRIPMVRQSLHARRQVLLHRGAFAT